jgi:GTP-binding protein Era
LTNILDVQDIVPISALQNQNLDRLLDVIRVYLPENDHFYPEDQLTDKSSRFLAAEIIREKITRQLGDELPYQMTVEIETFKETEKIIHIDALILVEREGQKRILIGDKGARIKQIGQQAREDMERLFDLKVMLKTWVKVKSGWSDDERALRSLGYHDQKK